MKPTVVAASVLAAALAVTSAGCTSDDTGEPTTSSSVNAVSDQDRQGMVDIASCPKWELTPVPVGAVGYQPSGEELDQYDRDLADCLDENGWGTNRSTDHLYRSMAEQMYDVFRARADCLRGFGIEIPQAPSKEAFIEDMLYNGVEWNPDQHLYEQARPDVIAEADRECLQPS